MQRSASGGICRARGSTLQIRNPQSAIRNFQNGSQTGLSAKLFSLLQICFFCTKPILPGLYKGFFTVGPHFFDLQIVPTVGSAFSPIQAIVPA